MQCVGEGLGGTSSDPFPFQALKRHIKASTSQETSGRHRAVESDARSALVTPVGSSGPGEREGLGVQSRVQVTGGRHCGALADGPGEDQSRNPWLA